MKKMNLRDLIFGLPMFMECPRSQQRNNALYYTTEKTDEMEEEEGGRLLKTTAMNKVDAGCDRATRHRLDMMTKNLSPLSLRATVHAGATCVDANR
jgi:hypothetical protein